MEMIKLWYTQLIEHYTGTRIMFMNLCDHLKHPYMLSGGENKHTKLYI